MMIEEREISVAMRDWTRLAWTSIGPDTPRPYPCSMPRLCITRTFRGQTSPIYVPPQTDHAPLWCGPIEAGDIGASSPTATFMCIAQPEGRRQVRGADGTRDTDHSVSSMDHAGNRGQTQGRNGRPIKVWREKQWRAARARKPALKAIFSVRRVTAHWRACRDFRDFNPERLGHVSLLTRPYSEVHEY